LIYFKKFASIILSGTNYRGNHARYEGGVEVHGGWDLRSTGVPRLPGATAGSALHAPADDCQRRSQNASAQRRRQEGQETAPQEGFFLAVAMGVRRLTPLTSDATGRPGLVPGRPFQINNNKLPYKG